MEEKKEEDERSPLSRRQMLLREIQALQLPVSRDVMRADEADLSLVLAYYQSIATDEIRCIAMRVCQQQLGTSFHVLKSNGFLAFQKSFSSK